MLFAHELYSVGISFRICSSLSTIPSCLSPLSSNSVFSLCPLLGLPGTKKPRHTSTRPGTQALGSMLLGERINTLCLLFVCLLL